MTTIRNKWLIKLENIWDRKDTAGFYELKELFESEISKVRTEAEKEIIRKWQQAVFYSDKGMGNLSKEVMDSHLEATKNELKE